MVRRSAFRASTDMSGEPHDHKPSAHSDFSSNRGWKNLQTTLGARIAQGMAGAISSKSIAVITDEELAASQADQPLP